MSYFWFLVKDPAICRQWLKGTKKNHKNGERKNPLLFEVYIKLDDNERVLGHVQGIKLKEIAIPSVSPNPPKLFE